MTALARHTVLVPVDYSTETQHALAVARDVVETGGVVHAVHVVYSPPIGIMAPRLTPQERTAHGLEHLRQFLADADIFDVKTHVMEGDSGHEIVKLAEKLHADLIVMPSDGRTGLAHILIGSVAERVVRLAHCPVLVLRK